MSKKKLFLAGGGKAKDSSAIDRIFVSNIERTGKKLLYLPIAMETDFIGYEACYDWIIKTLTQYVDNFLDIEMWLDLSDKTQDDLNKFSAIYIGGGNTFKLLDLIKKTNFFDLLVNFIMDGGIVYGGSAGAIIIGKNINTVAEENNCNYIYYEGMNFLRDHSVICHYSTDKDKKIQNFIKTYNIPVLAIPEKGGLVLTGDVCSVVGDLPVKVFYTDSKIKILKPSDNFIF